LIPDSLFTSDFRYSGLDNSRDTLRLCSHNLNIGEKKNMCRLVGVMLVLLTSIASEAASDQCLIVRSAEGHRFRNSMIAGALTGGIGFAAGAAFSGAKYEYADSFNLPSTKTKYKGKELEELQKSGVHVIVVNKKTASAEMDSARNSCRSVAPAAAPAPVPTAAAAAAPLAAESSVQTSTPAAAPSVTQEPSLGDTARQAKAQKQQQQPPK
jgi:hypothetical protein